MADLTCSSIDTLEKKKFTENTSGDICVRTCTEITNSSITTAPDGISGPFKVTTMTVGDSATLIPATDLTDRKSYSIANLSEVDILYIGPANTVTADSVNGTTSGWEIGPNETINLPFKNGISVYGIAETGKSVQIKIFEVA